MKDFYFDQNSFLHRLNPLSKIVAVFPSLTFLIVVTDPWCPGGFVLFWALLTIFLGKIKIGWYLKRTLPLVLLTTGFIIIYPFIINPKMVSDTQLLFTIFDKKIYLDGIIYGLTTALRAMAMMLGTLVFVITSDLADFIRSLVQQVKLPYRIGFSMMATFRFIPMLSGEMDNIKAAHKVRGVSDKRGLIAQYSRMRRYSIPLLATGIRKAERVALAMESRAFGAYQDRTWFRKSRFNIYDGIFIVCCWALSLFYLLIINHAGLMGNLIFLR